MVSTNNVFAGFAFIGFSLVVTLLPLHIQARNIGTCAFIIWTGLLCFNGFINAVVWDHRDTNMAPVWCDISSRLSIAGPIGIPAASLCIARHLYTVTRDESIDDPAEPEHDVKRRRAILFDYFLVVGIPILHVVASYVIQIFRFVVYEDVGCRAALVNTHIAYPLLKMWPIILSLILAGYAGVIIYKLNRRRAQMHSLVQPEHNGYFHRLLALIMVILLCSFPPSLASTIIDATENRVYPWPGWKESHADISVVAKIPYVILKKHPLMVASLEYSRWIYVVYAIIFFAFFGFTTEMKRLYRSVFMHLIPEQSASSKKTRTTDNSSGSFAHSTLATYQSDAFHDSSHISGISDEHIELKSYGLSQNKSITHPPPVHDITSVLSRSPPHITFDDLAYDVRLAS